MRAFESGPLQAAVLLSKRMKADKLLSYLLAQFAGAFLAGAVLYGLLAPTISAYELAHGIVRWYGGLDRYSSYVR